MEREDYQPIQVISKFTIPVISKFVADKGFEKKVRLPQRATSGSAGYDFFANEKIIINPNDSVVIDTHVKADIDEGWFLMVVPRSGLGFKYRVSLANTVGIIDSDYFSIEPEKGVVKVKLYNPGDVAIEIPKGKAFAQGIFVPFGITEDDCPASEERNGNGFGSTDKQ